MRARGEERPETEDEAQRRQTAGSLVNAETPSADAGRDMPRAEPDRAAEEAIDYALEEGQQYTALYFRRRD